MYNSNNSHFARGVSPAFVNEMRKTAPFGGRVVETSVLFTENEKHNQTETKENCM